MAEVDTPQGAARGEIEIKAEVEAYASGYLPPTLRLSTCFTPVLGRR